MKLTSKRFYIVAIFCFLFITVTIGISALYIIHSSNHASFWSEVITLFLGISIPSLSSSLVTKFAIDIKVEDRIADKVTEVLKGFFSQYNQPNPDNSSSNYFRSKQRAKGAGQGYGPSRGSLIPEEHLTYLLNNEIISKRQYRRIKSNTN